MYQALYRKYRPVDFDSVVGQNSIVNTLKNSIIYNKVNHAYLFFGPRGTGKTTLSKIFARSINCLDPVDGCSCGKCNNCLHSYEKECIDIIELDAASNNGVDEVREIINNVSLVPTYLKYKVYIIDEVHMLSTGAFNALLKTLEEPPEHVVFILATTDPQKVPETIISRCQCFSFKRISNDLIVDYLKDVSKKEKIKISDDVLEQIAIASNGGMRDSLVLLDQLSSFTDKKIDMDIYSDLNGTITYQDIDGFINDILSGSITSVIHKIRIYNNNGKNLILIINQMINYARNLVVDNYTSNKRLSNVDLYVDFINYFNENLYNLKNSDNIKIYFEGLILKFIFDHNLDNSESIVEEEIVVEKNISKTKDTTNENIIEKKVESKTSKTIEKPSDFQTVDKKILNIDDIMKVRINNVFAMADKKEKNNFIKLKDKFSDYIFDTDCGFIASLVVDSSVLVASKDSVLLGIKYDSSIEQLNECFSILSDVFKKVLDKEYTVSYITEDKWKNYADQYVNNMKNGIKYEVLEEPLPIFEETKKDDIISSSAINLFGEEIVEVS